MADVNLLPAIAPAPQSTFLSDEAKRRMLAAQLLQKQASDTSAPVYSTGAGFAKLGAGLMGGLMEGYTESKEADANKANAALLGQYLSAGAAPAVPAAPVASAPMGALPSMPAAGVVPNDGNAAPGTVGMNQRLADLSYDFIDDNPGTRISSGVRSTADQARLYADRGNNPNPVAFPGASKHERGMAVDIGGMTPDQRAALPSFGLAQPVRNDPPHVELALTDPSQQPYQVAGPAVAAPGAGQPSPQALAAAIQAPAPLGPDRMALAAQLLADPRTPAGMREYIMKQVGPKDPIHLKDGETLLDPRTFKPIAGGDPKPTDELREYDFYKKQGGTASFFDYKSGLKKAGAQNISIDQKPELAFDTEAGKLQAKRFDELAADGQTARQMVSDVKTLTDLGKNIGTGKTAEAKAALGPYAEALGLKVDGLSDIQAYEAVVNRVAPNLRVKGSGAQSDMELKNFLKSLPTLGNTPEGNAIASQVMTGLQENKIRAAEIGSKALTKEITRSEAEKQLRELPDPMTNYRDYMKTNRGAPTASAKMDEGWVNAGPNVRIRERK